MDKKLESPAPPTLRFLSRDVSAIQCECLAYRYKRELPLAPLLERHGDEQFPSFARKLKCSACGSHEVFARPAWRDPLKRGHDG